MSKRLQVLFDEDELAEIRETARRQRMTTAEWVRQALRVAQRDTPRGNVKKRLEVVRAAARHEFPTADVEQMLAEIERGYTGERPR